MSIDRLDWLADSVLDGVATAEERSEFERLVAADPNARARFEERRELFETLGRVLTPTPPDDLRDSILATIRNESRPMSRSSGVGNWRSLLARHPTLGLSYAVAAGLVIGSLITLATMGTINRAPGPNASISGTMGTPLGAEHSLDHARLDFPGGNLEAATSSFGRIVRLHLRGHASVPVELTIAFRPHELHLVSIVPPESGSMSITRSNGRLLLKTDREMNLEVNWDPRVPAASPLRIGCRVNGKEETMIMTVSPKGRDSPGE